MTQPSKLRSPNEPRWFILHHHHHRRHPTTHPTPPTATPAQTRSLPERDPTPTHTRTSPHPRPRRHRLQPLPKKSARSPSPRCRCWSDRRPARAAGSSAIRPTCIVPPRSASGSPRRPSAHPRYLSCRTDGSVGSSSGTGSHPARAASTATCGGHRQSDRRGERDLRTGRRHDRVSGFVRDQDIGGRSARTQRREGSPPTDHGHRKTVGHRARQGLGHGRTGREAHREHQVPIDAGHPTGVVDQRI